MKAFNFSHPLSGPLLLLVVLTAIALFARPLTPIDETRYVSVAWEMWLRDEYFVLFKNGETYSHKPPLMFWLFNLGWSVFGVSEWWPRLISPLFSLGGLLLTLSIARRLWPDDLDCGHRALWILASSLLWMVFSTSAMFDVMLAFFVLLGMRGLLIAAQGSIARGFAWLAFAIGLGVLAKGPVVLLHVLPVAVLAPWWKPGLKWKSWYPGILLAVLGGAAIALAWAIPAALRGGEEYRNAIFWGQTANRMVDSFAHKRPFWWYLPLLPVLLFPWLVWPELWKRLLALKHRGLDTGLRFCLAWVTPVFVAFSLISGKQIHYLVPLFPAFALMAGRVLSQGPVSSLLPFGLVGLVGIAMTAAAFIELPKSASLEHGFEWWPGVLVLILAGWLGWGAKQQPLVRMAVLSAGMFVLLQLYLNQNLRAAYDVRPMAEQIRVMQDRGMAVANEGGYHAQYQFEGRLKQPLARLSQEWLEQNPEGVAVVYFSRGKEPSDVLFRQPYRGEVAVLMSAAQVKENGVLDAKRKSKIKREELEE